MTFRSRNPKRIPAIALSRVDFPASLRPRTRLMLEGSRLDREAPVELAEAVELDLEQPHLTPPPRSGPAGTRGSRPSPARSSRRRSVREGDHRDRRPATARRRRRRRHRRVRLGRRDRVLVEELLEADRQRALGDGDLAVDVAVGVGRCACSRSFSRRWRIRRTKKPRIVFSAPIRRRSELCSNDDRSTSLRAANRSRSRRRTPRDPRRTRASPSG